MHMIHTDISRCRFFDVMLLFCGYFHPFLCVFIRLHCWIILDDTHDDFSIKLIIIFWNQYCIIVWDNGLAPVRRQPVSNTILTQINAALQRQSVSTKFGVLTRRRFDPSGTGLRRLPDVV